MLPATARGAIPEDAQRMQQVTEPMHLTPLAQTRRQSRFTRLVISELLLMLKGQRWWWYAGAAGILIGGLVSPGDAARQGWLVAAWIWPILLWSQMGAREARYETQPLIFSSPRALHRQLPAAWTAGVLVALLTGAGVGARLLIGADWQGLAGWLAGALFIPSLALTLGVWSGTTKLFEAVYTVWWYMGALHHVPDLDFTRGTPTSSAPLAYLVAAVLLLAASFAGRRVRLGYA